ncbi:hypothetical protein [Roseibium sediminicola]|uniref:Uncharacterized protein n=1 Tax=Roseibium sediminicola TaxID=2933272 RepID=A0ABT0GYR1_9HYPH|nr:hypothetical protein [Roseibium sp. CAU 1639]MCK7614202.1 hypothetical protein [Roseibium sp. CAU 1639]
MIVTWLKSQFWNRRTTLYTGSGSGSDGNPQALPTWMARDLGLEDPENRKAVLHGGCRKPDRAVPVAMLPKRPRRS